MYSPTTRLLTVLELLQSHRQMSGSEIARRLEIDVRTVRRYIVMLQDMGIPVRAERGAQGAYHLARGHRLPPLLFSDTEAVAMTMGLLFIREYGFPVDVAAVEGALSKTERVLPENLLHQVRSIQEAIRFHIETPPAELKPGLIVPLSVAVQEHQQVHLRYRSPNGVETNRLFDPYGIALIGGAWYTIGYCHLREDVRTFRLDRVTALEPGEQTFERPENFDTIGEVLRSITFIPSPYEVEVVLETTLEQAQQAISPFLGTVEQTKQGVIFRRTTASLDWIALELISLDFLVRVIQPEELRQVLARIVEKAKHMIGEDREPAR